MSSPNAQRHVPRSHDVREVMEMAEMEVATVLAPYAAGDLRAHLPRTMADLGLLAQAGVLDSFGIYLHVGRVLVREYWFTVDEGAVTPFGPGPQNPPVGPLPEGVQAELFHLRDEPHLSLEAARWAKWLPPGTSFELKGNGEPEETHYGAYGSATFGLHRMLYVYAQYPLEETKGP